MEKYDDIINLPHYEPRRHPRMSTEQRAAQFAPFAALVGYEAALEETGRLTDCMHEVSEDVKEAINRQLQWVADHLPEHPQVTITYFVLDDKKAGGVYRMLEGVVKKIDDYAHTIILESGVVIPIPFLESLYVRR